MATPNQLIPQEAMDRIRAAMILTMPETIEVLRRELVSNGAGGFEATGPPEVEVTTVGRIRQVDDKEKELITGFGPVTTLTLLLPAVIPGLDELRNSDQLRVNNNQIYEIISVITGRTWEHSRKVIITPAVQSEA